MSDAPTPKDSSGPQSVGDMAFTVPEKVADVRVTDQPVESHEQNRDKELFDVGRAFSGDAVQKGTIVSDRKRAHTGIGTMLVSAWSEWWGNTQKSLESTFQKLESHPLLSPKEETTIASPHTRSEIIQEASTLGTQAPRDDHALIREKIRSQVSDSDTTPLPTFAIKSAEAKASPTWTSTTEILNIPTEKTPLPAPLDLRNGVATSESDKNQPIATPQPPVPLSRKESTLDLSRGNSRSTHDSTATKTGATTPLGWSHFRDGIPQPVSTKEDARPPRIPAYEIPKPSITQPQAPRVAPLPPPSPVPQPAKSAPTPPPVTRTRESVPTPPAPPRDEPRIPPEPPFVNKNPHAEATLQTQSIFLRIPRAVLLGVVVVIGITSGVMVALTSSDSSTDIPQSKKNEARMASILTMGKTTPIAFSSDPRAFLIALAGARESGGEVNEEFVLITPDEEGGNVTASEFFDVVGSSAPAPFRRSLTGAYSVGVLREGLSAPYIVLSSPEYERAFGGMLAWESALSSDLSPFFGTTVTSSLVPGKEDATQGAYFVDAIRGNGAVRILYDELGNERILYALVHNKYIVITTGTEAFATLLTHLH